jgi:hypothetical protein
MSRADRQSAAGMGSPHSVRDELTSLNETNDGGFDEIAITL